MKKVVLTLVVAASLLLMFAHVLQGQQAEAPVYKGGDWWRVKVALLWVKAPPQARVSEPCFTAYSEYLVKMDARELKVFGAKTLLEGEQLEEINCPAIISNVLAKSKEDLKFPLSVDLQFPMRVGFTWPSPIAPVTYKVQSWEKIKTPKGEFGAFRILRTDSPGWKLGRPATYYYSPEVKAIVYSREQAEESGYLLIYSLIDFHLNK